MKKNNENSLKQTEKRDNKYIKFVEKHNLVISLSLVILIVLLWAVIKMHNMQKDALVEKQQLTEEYEGKLENLSISSLELTAQVFSWAIRGEMLRQNMDQVYQYFTSFIQETGISKIQLIDPVSATIILSTDKKDEGVVINDTRIIQAQKTFHIPAGDRVMIINPVMGLNSMIGVLVIELNINKSQQ